MTRPASLLPLLAAALLLPAAAAFQVDAQSASSSPGTWALVGARIVDGSGNEPFEGTIVVRDGRIAEVGRSATPPAGALVIDGKGRTVTPGLIDLQVALPPDRPAAVAPAAPASASTSGGGSSASGSGRKPAKPSASSAKGRGRGTKAGSGGRSGTSAAPETPAADASGGGTGTAAGAGSQAGPAPVDPLTRALAAYVYAGVTTVAASGVDSSAFDAVRDRLAAKGIPAPRLIAPRAEGASAVAPGLARVAQPAQRKATPLLGEMLPASWLARLQAADAAAAGGDASRWQAAVDKVKALRAANTRIGVASGAAGVTAAGAGVNAGANGGTSDSGSAAATSSATDVSLPYGWTTLLEARLLGEAGLTPLQAVTAATSGGSWALGLQSDRGFIAVGQRADLVVFAGNPTATLADVEKIERVFLGGQEIDRAALRALLTRDDAPAPAPASAAPTAPAETSAAGGTAAPATGTGAAPSTPAAGDRGNRSNQPNTGAPANSATPSAAAPAAAATAVAGVALDNPLVDDFEGSGEGTNLGRTWQANGDPSTIPATIIAGRVVRGLRDHALHLTARMGDAAQPYAAVNVRLGSNGAPVDVSRYRGIRFDARGEGRYRVVFVTRSVADGHYHVSYFSGSPLWTPVSIPFASLGQTGAGSHVAWTGRDLLEISFQVARDPGQMGWLELDNVRFY